ncbi:MAG: M20/M25/M40 family metallo-hydrolase [Gemmiger sp.]|nr:M20/M25/M40 family metallo-hydrolase [Gemmiger sp.]
MKVQGGVKSVVEIEQVRCIKKWVQAHRDELVGDICKIVDIPSVSQPQQGQEAPFGAPCNNALRAVLALGERFGLNAENTDHGCGQLWWQAGAPQTKKTLGLWAHLDVVPADAGWYYPPFASSVHDNYLIGRGVQDNKGPAIALLYVLRCLKETGFTLPYTVAACYGTSEENGMLDLQAWLPHHRPPDYNLVADCGFPLCHGEMGDLKVQFRWRQTDANAPLALFAGNALNIIPDYASCRPAGSTRLLEGYGVAAHVAAPKNSKNAIHDLATKMAGSATGIRADTAPLWEFLQRMTADNHGHAAGIAEKDEVSGELVGTITMIRTTPDAVVLSADYRYPIFHGDSLSDGSRVLEKLKALGKRYGLEVCVLSNSKPSFFPEQAPFVQALMKSYRACTGSKTPPFVMSGGSYARMLPNAVAYGMASEHKTLYREMGWPNGIGDYHQTNESICIEELMEGIVIYCLSLLELKF